MLNKIDSLIQNELDTTLDFVKQVYTLLTERQLLPPIKIYETQSATTESYLLKEKEMVKLPRDELDFLKRGGVDENPNMNESKKEGKTCSLNNFYSFHIKLIIYQESS